MAVEIQAELAVPFTRDEQARQGFIGSMRRFVMNRMADALQQVYERDVAPKLNGGSEDELAIHAAMAEQPAFKFYSVMRMNTQRMLWRSVIPGVERALPDLQETLAELSAPSNKAAGTLTLDPDFDMPDYGSAIDVHQMPGSYTAEYGDDDIAMGAVFEEGVAIVSMGFLGRRMEDIGETMALYIKHRFPDFQPRRILDLGCTTGHSTLPWVNAFPDAEVHGVDLAAPVLRYAHARSQARGLNAHYHQQDATALDFEPESFDLVFSSMLLHEIAPDRRQPLFDGIAKVLRPGGLMLHYELPPSSLKSAYENFYLNWDSFYNIEPFYRSFRALELRPVLGKAGLDADNAFDFVTPSLEFWGKDAVIDAAERADNSAGNMPVGRLVKGVKWYGVGAFKPEAGQ